MPLFVKDIHLQVGVCRLSLGSPFLRLQSALSALRRPRSDASPLGKCRLSSGLKPLLASR